MWQAKERRNINGGKQMNLESIIVIAMSFLNVMFYFLVVIGIVGIFVFVYLFKFIVEVHKKTGSGFVSYRNRARKTKDSDGNYSLVTLRGARYLYPKDNTCIYRQGYAFVVRFYERGLDDYHPIILKQNLFSKVKNIFKVEKGDIDKFVPLEINVEPEGAIWMEPIPQNIKYVFKQQQANITLKYAQKQAWMAKYGGLVGIGAIGVMFIMGFYFISQNIESAITLGNTVVSKAAALSGQIAVQSP